MKVKELLSNEGKWTQNSNAKNLFGMMVPAESQDACRWCLYGAIVRCYPEGEQAMVCHAVRRRLKISADLGITGWNDHYGRNFKDVQQLANDMDIQGNT